MEEIKVNLKYLVMPSFVYEDNRLNDVSRRVYCFIHTFKGEYFFFSNEHMAKMFGCHPQSISDAVTQLKDLDYVGTTYKSKPSGGKTRLVIDTYSDKSFTLSRVSKTEAPTKSKRLDNGSNGNNLMTEKAETTENELSKNENFENWKEAREDRKSKPKSPFLLSYPSPSYSKSLYPVKTPKTGFHAEDIK
jgi:hypothetical protein